MERKNLYIDFDGVILDTLTPIHNIIKEQNITNDEEKEKLFREYPWKKLINEVAVIENAFENIEEIIKSDKFNLAILTHVYSIEEAVIKIKYIRKYFSDITIIPCPKEISKTKMVHTKDSILIDDYAGNLREWEKEGGIPVRFNLNGSGKGFTVIKNLKEIIDLF